MLYQKLKQIVMPSLLVFLVSNSAIGAEELTLTTPARPPYGPGETLGFTGEIATEIFKRLNIKINVITLPGERSIKNVNEGIEDGELSRIGGLEEKYPNLVMVPEKMLDFDFVAFVMDENIELKTWSDLSTFNVGIITGWKMFELNVTNANKIIKVKNEEQLLRMLELGRIDVALYGRWEGLYALDQMKIDAHLVEPPLATIESFMYLNKKHKDLAPKAAKALAEMKSDGTYQRISEQTLGIYK